MTEPAEPTNSSKEGSPSKTSPLKEPTPEEAIPGLKWMSSWFETAKKTTIETFDMVKKDLSEFGECVDGEVNKFYDATASTVKSSIPKIENTSTRIAHSLSDGVQRILAMEDTTVDEEEFEVAIGALPEKRTGTSSTSSSRQGIAKPLARSPATIARLHKIQADPETYACDPVGAPELFEDWLQSFDLANHRLDLAQLLANNADVRKFYKQLVPKTLSDDTFWERYFYRVHCFELDEIRLLEGDKCLEEIEKDTSKTTTGSTVMATPDVGVDELEDLVGVDEIDIGTTRARVQSIGSEYTMPPGSDLMDYHSQQFLNELEEVAEKSDNSIYDPRKNSNSASPPGNEDETASSVLSSGWASGLSTPPAVEDVTN